MNTFHNRMSSFLRCTRKSLFVMLSLFAMSIACLTPARAQDPPTVAQGLNPVSTYFTGNFDFVDMSTGRLNLHIPLVVDKSQRGKLNFSYSLSYTNPSWVYSCAPDGSSCELGGLSTSGPQLGPLPILEGGLLGIGADTIEANGADHPMAPVSYGVEESVDGSGIQQIFVGAELAAINKDGIRFVGNMGGNSTYIEDANGNVMTMSGGNQVESINGGFGPGLFFYDSYANNYSNSWTMSDTLGRSWSFNGGASTSGCPVPVGTPSGALSRATTWAAPGVGGGTRQFTFCYSTITISDSSLGVSSYEDTVLTAVILPDLTSWQFEYGDGHGEVTTVLLPTGGYINYTYTENVVRTVLKREVCDPVNCQTWNYDFSNLYSTGIVTVTDPLYNATVYTIAGADVQPLVTQVQYYDAVLGLLQTTGKQYATYGSSSSYAGITVLPTGEDHHDGERAE